MRDGNGLKNHPPPLTLNQPPPPPSSSHSPGQPTQPPPAHISPLVFTPTADQQLWLRFIASRYLVGWKPITVTFEATAFVPYMHAPALMKNGTFAKVLVEVFPAPATSAGTSLTVHYAIQAGRRLSVRQRRWGQKGLNWGGGKVRWGTNPPPKLLDDSAAGEGAESQDDSQTRRAEGRSGTGVVDVCGCQCWPFTTGYGRTKGLGGPCRPHFC